LRAAHINGVFDALAGQRLAVLHDEALLPGRAWSKSMSPAGCSPSQTPFQGPKSPWQTISPGAQVHGPLD